MPRCKTQEETISDFRKAHGNFYDYSKVEYVTSSQKVRVICLNHGEFLITPSHHKNGVGCRKCYFDSQKITKDEFIKRSQNHFGKRYDYTLIGENIASKKKVSIKCIEHELFFEQDPKNHMGGHTGCLKCKTQILSGSRHGKEFKTQKELNNDFSNRAMKVHGKKYGYEKFIYINSNTKGKIFCKIHGEFYQSPSNHLRGRQCPDCAIESQKEDSFKRQCKNMGVNYFRALKRRQAGLSEEFIFTKEYIKGKRKINEIVLFGEKYPNIAEAIRVLQPPSSSKTIIRWIQKEGMVPEEAFERVANPGYAEGIIYLVTNKETGKKYIGLTIQTIERRWKYHIEQAKAGHIKSTRSLHFAIRTYGEKSFLIEKIDIGTAKKDLELKERMWIKDLNTLIPNGYNISTGGVSGGSNKKSTIVDGTRFESAKKAAEYVAKTRKISFPAASRRILKGRVDIKTPAKPGNSLVKTRAYKVWSRIIHEALNPKSRDYISGISIYENWREFEKFYNDVGEPTESNMAFARIDKEKGFYPSNCEWMTKSQASKINAKYMKKRK